jgi:hypothetical protein
MAKMNKPKGRLSREGLLKIIDTEAILRNLLACAKGERLMTPEQLRAASMLLARSMPEIRQAETTVTTFDGNPDEISNAELAAIIAAHSSDDAPGKAKRPH